LKEKEKMMPAVEEARAKHWNDLAVLLGEIVAWWRQYYFEKPENPSLYIVGNFDLETVDTLLANSLLAHLKAEFEEWSWMNDWSDLVATNLRGEIVEQMRRVSYRRTFVGTCDICRDWEDTTPPGTAHGATSSSLAAGGIRTQDVIDSLLGVKRYQRLKESSLKTYQKHYTIFAKEFPLLPTDQGIIMHFLERFEGESGRTRLNWQADLNMLYRHASEKFNMPNPIAGLPRPRIKHRPVKTLSLIEAGLLDTTPDTVRDRTALDLLLGHGWRQVEVRRITADDVRDVRDGIIWVRGKERDEYTPLLPETEARLTQMAEGLGPEDRVFRGPRDALGEEGLSRLVGRLYKRAGLHNIAGHDLRRTFATMVREASGDEFLAMRLLRDRIPGQNDRYLAVTPAILREALEKYSPLRLIKNVSPAQQDGECLGEDGECPREDGECMVETGESRTPRPEEAAQDILQV
jgi:integrase